MGFARPVLSVIEGPALSQVEGLNPSYTNSRFILRAVRALTLRLHFDVLSTNGEATTLFGNFIIARHTSRSPWLITALPHRDASVLDSARMTVVMAQNQVASSSEDAEKEIARKSSNL